MLERFKFGSYRIEDTELAHSKSKPKSKSVGQILVKFLDSSNVKFTLDVSNNKQSTSAFIYPHSQSFRKRPRAVIYWTKPSSTWNFQPNGTILG